VAGGSYAAIHAVKIICKHVIPKAIQKNPNFKASITVIAPNRETYWNVAAVRIISDPEVLKTHADQIFFPLEGTLKKFLPTKGKFIHELNVIQGKVLSVDSELSMLTYLKLTDSGEPHHGDHFFCQTVVYNKLILATGASSSSPAFKLNGSTELTKAALRQLQEASAAAETICIVGAGGAGVELAGELGYKYHGTKKITLYSAFDGTLERLRQKIADDAIPKLKNLGVETVTSSRAIAAYKERPQISPLRSQNAPKPLQSQPSFSSTHRTVASSSHALESNLGSPQSTEASDSHPRSVTALTPPASPSSTVGTSSSTEEYLNNFCKGELRTIPSSATLVPSMPVRAIKSHDKIVLSQNKRPNFSKPITPSTPNFTNIHKSEMAASTSIESGKLPKKPNLNRTVVAFENGVRKSFDCYIPTTGNIPNSSFLPHTSLDSNGYVLTDPYLRMAHNNPYNDIYVYGDLVSGGNQNISDICEEQKQTLKATLIYDVLGHEDPSGLKRYKPNKNVTYYVPISKHDGIGQTMYGIPLPGFIVSIVKGKTFRLKQSHRYLNDINP
jgi:NADH dehydrogenase FAD-containing subunit